MKAIGKKLGSLTLASALVMGMAANVSAATNDYSVKVVNGKLQFIQHGAVAGTFSPKVTDVTLTTDKDGDFLVCYRDAKGTFRGVTLGDQKELTISGTMESLTFSQNLSDKVIVTLAGGSNAKEVTVNNKSKLTIDGDVTTLTLNNAAAVTVGKNASINKAQKSNKDATIKTTSGKTISATSIRKPGATTKPSKNNSSDKNSSNSDDLRMKIRAINSDGDSTLSDLLEDLNDNVEVTERKSGDTVDGECRWNSRRTSSIIDRDGTYDFTFYPDDSRYDPIEGTIKIYTDDISENLTLVYDGGKDSTSPITAPDGGKLGDIRIKSYIRVENEDGDEVKGRFDWDKKSSTKLEKSDGVRGYGFTFKPNNSRYDNIEGTLYIIAN